MAIVCVLGLIWLILSLLGPPWSILGILDESGRFGVLWPIRMILRLLRPMWAILGFQGPMCGILGLLPRSELDDLGFLGAYVSDLTLQPCQFSWFAEPLGGGRAPCPRACIASTCLDIITSTGSALNVEHANMVVSSPRSPAPS